MVYVLCGRYQMKRIELLKTVSFPGLFDELNFPELPGVDDFDGIPQLSDEQALYLSINMLPTQEIIDSVASIKEMILARKLEKLNKRIGLHQRRDCP